MILLVGDSDHPVIVRLATVLRCDGHRFLLLDTSTASPDQLRAPRSPGPAPWRVVGGEFEGQRPIRAVFVRQGRSVDPSRRATAMRLWAKIERMLLGARAPVMNRPSAGAGNYAKVHQLLRMAAAGLPVPLTQVTNIPAAALQFILDQQGAVLTKGLSNAKTIPRVIDAADLSNIDGVRACPAQMQQIAGGRDLRLTVAGPQAIASLPVAGGGFRHVDGLEVLPEAIVRRCVQFVADEHLLLGGFDLRESPERITCFELNATPLFTHYDTDVAPVLTRAVIRCLLDVAFDVQDILV